MDAKTVAHLSKSDKVLAKLMKRIGPITLKPLTRQPPYEALVESVVYQQLTGKAAATIFGRVKALYPKSRFPRPEELLDTPEDTLRQAGLSRAKTAALKDIALKTVAGVVPTSRTIARMPDAEIIERLTTIRGVGPWTVDMVLIFKLGRPDILPATDYGVRKGFAQTYQWAELPTPKELLAEGERWRPYRTTAAWYLWRSLDAAS
jgi:DNA-3-methyladenine glycosylase II